MCADTYDAFVWDGCLWLQGNDADVVAWDMVTYEEVVRVSTAPVYGGICAVCGVVHVSTRPFPRLCVCVCVCVCV